MQLNKIHKTNVNAPITNAFRMPTYFNGKLNTTQTRLAYSNEEHKSQAPCYFIFWSQDNLFFF